MIYEYNTAWLIVMFSHNTGFWRQSIKILPWVCKHSKTAQNNPLPCLLFFFQIINYSTKMFAQSNFDEAKYLTLGVGAVNVAFTIVAVSIHYMMFMFSQVSVQRIYVCMYVCMYYWPVQWFTGLLSAKKKKKEADWDDKNFWCSTKSGVSTLWIIKPISRSVIWLYSFHVHQNSCLVLFLLRKRLFCVLVTFLDILFLSLFSKVLFGGESWTQETVACWISVTSALQPTYDHHIFNTGEDEDCFLNSRNEVKILDSFLHLLSSLFSRFRP